MCGSSVASVPGDDGAEVARRRGYVGYYCSDGGAGCSWVEVETKKGEVYFWDFRSMKSLAQLPAGAQVHWQAFEARPGVFYYQDVKTKELGWSLPGMAVASSRHAWIEPGTAVAIEQCRYDGRYTGQAGVVVCRRPNDCAAVKLPEQLGDVVLEVPYGDLGVLRKGTHVELHGIEQVGTIEDGVMDEHLKMRVRLPDDAIKIVKVTTMVPRSRLWAIDLWQHLDRLQWCKEQENIFISVDGQHHCYYMHLPFGFDQQLKTGRWPEPWPLLIFMHGAGRGTLLSQSKKALKSAGLEYVAARFVIVSPKCTWSWKKPPESWVAELARYLRACSWVDPERIYLTGCSMGGMGTWEVAAAVPDVFAAVVPVAAYHNADNTAHLSEKLREMPVLAVHSIHDVTCPLPPEEELWQALRRKGNQRVQVCCAPHVDHCEVFDRAYCDSAMIFEWLLRHRRLAGPAFTAAVTSQAPATAASVEISV